MCNGTWDSVDHVDPDDPNPEAWRRTQASLHHKVDFHLEMNDDDLHTSGWIYLYVPFDKCVARLFMLSVVYNLESWPQPPIHFYIYENCA